MTSRKARKLQKTTRRQSELQHDAHASLLRQGFSADRCLHERLWLFADRLGHHQPCGLCCPRVSKHERVGGDVGERRLPRVQLLAKVSPVHPLTLSTDTDICPLSTVFLGTEYRSAGWLFPDFCNHLIAGCYLDGVFWRAWLWKRPENIKAIKLPVKPAGYIICPWLVLTRLCGLHQGKLDRGGALQARTSVFSVSSQLRRSLQGQPVLQG